MNVKIVKFENEKAAEAGFFSDADSRIRAILTYDSEDLGRGSFKFEAAESLAAGAARFKRQVAFEIWFEDNMFSSYSDIGIVPPVDDRGEPFTVVDDFVCNGKGCMPHAEYAAGMAALEDHAVSMVNLEFQFEAGIPEELITALQNEEQGTKYLANAFSGQMLTELGDCTIERAIVEKPDLSGYKSVIGHQDLADLLNVECNREFVTLKEGDELLVAQIMGGRLPEGCTTLPEGVRVEYHRYTFKAMTGGA